MSRYYLITPASSPVVGTVTAVPYVLRTCSDNWSSVWTPLTIWIMDSRHTMLDNNIKYIDICYLVLCYTVFNNSY